MTSYEGLSVVITGASEGLGATLARELSARGARLTLGARTQPALEAVAADCVDAIAVPTDVTSRADVQRLADRALAERGRIDVWVSNAGQGNSRRVDDLSDDELDAMLNVNLRSVLYGIQAALPVMREQNSGVIANVSSVLSRWPRAHFRSAYNLSKAAVNSLGESLRLQLAEEGSPIRVVTVLPGMVSTDFSLNALGDGEDMRANPMSQDVNDCARVIADGLLEGPADLYTRPESYEVVSAYLASLVGK